MSQRFIGKNHSLLSFIFGDQKTHNYLPLAFLQLMGANLVDLVEKKFFFNEDSYNYSLGWSPIEETPPFPFTLGKKRMSK